MSVLAASATVGIAPAAGHARAEWIDALRGFALLGIAVYNIQVFSGFVFRGLMPDVAPLLSSWDAGLDHVAHVLVQGKFYSLFSLLFGAGMALQWSAFREQGIAPAPVLRRRLAWLLAIGLAHALLVWFGDILTTYAVLGLLLLPALRLSQRALLALALLMLASPLLIYLVFLAIGMGNPLGGRPGSGAESGLLTRVVDALRGGGWWDVVQAQAVLYPGGWLRRAVQLSLPRIVGMMLLGAWLVRAGMAADPRTRARELRATVALAVVVALPANIVVAWLGGTGALLPATPRGLLVAGLSTLGIPLLALGYAAAFALAWRPRTGSLFVAAGRTALTHYLGQSVLAVALFYGYGAGLFGRLGYGPAIVIALAVWLSLALAGRAWLRHHAQGPVEALWRALTHGRRPVSV